MTDRIPDEQRASRDGTVSVSLTNNGTEATVAYHTATSSSATRVNLRDGMVMTVDNGDISAPLQPQRQYAREVVDAVKTVLANHRVDDFEKSDLIQIARGGPAPARTR